MNESAEIFLEVNIEGEPPTQEDINRFRREISKSQEERRKRIRIRQIILFVLAILSGASLSSMLYYSPELSAATGLIGALASLTFISSLTLLIDLFLNPPPEKITEILDNLNDDQIIKYDDLISNNPEIKEYFRKLKGIGREPVVVDLIAAEEWVAKKPAQAARERMAHI